MLTLVIRQTLPNGVKKVWRLRPDAKAKTFGSSRLADVISIDPLAKGIQGTFEYRDDRWWYIDLNRANVESDQSPETRVDGKTTLQLDGSILFLETAAKDIKIFAEPEKFTATLSQDSTPKRPYTLFVVKLGSTVLETKVLPRGQVFTPEMKDLTAIKVISKDIDLKDAQELMTLTSDQIIDKDSKKAAYVLLSCAFLLFGTSFLMPKTEMATQLPQSPRAMKVVVMTDPMKKKHGIQAPKPPEQKPLQAKAAPTQAPQTPAPASGGKVAGMLKSFSAGRISQMLGKVSAQAAKTENVIVSVGVSASPDQGGRALAALGPINRPGKDWSKDAKGGGAGVSTAGRGGGGSLSGYGTLSGGNTGNAGVGLIEDESEIVGGLDRDVIAQYIKTQLGAILYCYERQLTAHPEMEGKVSVKFVIGGNGKVDEQKIGDTTLKNATVEGCILNRVAQWKFPTPRGGTKVVVTYPFLFKSTN
jgi:hypothetical protein